MTPTDTHSPAAPSGANDSVSVTLRADLSPIDPQAPAADEDGTPRGSFEERYSVKQQLLVMQEALKQERISRLQYVAQANLQISGMRRELEATGEARARRAMFRERLTSVFATVAIVAIALGLIGFARFHSDWWPRPANGTPATETSGARDPWDELEKDALAKAAPLGPPSPAAAQMYELARLNGALRTVPAAAVGNVLKSVNDWLSTHGEVPCWVRSHSGEVSLVVSTHSPGRPIMDALSRCADAVEQVTHQ